MNLFHRVAKTDLSSFRVFTAILFPHGIMCSATGKKSDLRGVSQ